MFNVDDFYSLCFYQQVQNKVKFPQEKTASEECKKLITKLLSPLNIRISISEIKKDPWYQQS